jgi:hypothetical protein
MSTPNTPATGTAKVEAKAPVIEYKLAENGEITRTDATDTIKVATLKETKGGKLLILVPEWAKFRAPIVRFLNEQSIAPKGVVLEGDEDDAEKRLIGKIPPMPKKNPRLGDKTPEVVEWYRRYKPEEYKARYGIRGDGTVTKTRKVLDEKTGQLKTETYEVEALIAERKTHLTEKIEANDATLNSGEGEYDESLDQAGE